MKKIHMAAMVAAGMACLSGTLSANDAVGARLALESRDTVLFRAIRSFTMELEKCDDDGLQGLFKKACVVRRRGVLAHVLNLESIQEELVSPLTEDIVAEAEKERAEDDAKYSEGTRTALAEIRARFKSFACAVEERQLFLSHGGLVGRFDTYNDECMRKYTTSLRAAIPSNEIIKILNLEADIKTVQSKLEAEAATFQSRNH